MLLRTTARITELSPGQSAPPVNIPTFFTKPPHDDFISGDPHPRKTGERLRSVSLEWNRGFLKILIVFIFLAALLLAAVFGNDFDDIDLDDHVFLDADRILDFPFNEILQA